MGSAGDVHPLVWLARLLQKRGHDVVMVVQAAVAFMAERAGVRHIAVGDEDEQNEVVRHPDLWHPRNGFKLLARYMPGYAREMIPVIAKELEPERTVLMGGSLAYSSRIAAERWNVPLLTVHLQPSLMMSLEDTPVMVAGMEWVARSPRWLKQRIFGVAHWQVDHHLRRPLGRVRRDAGVPGVMPKGVMRQWWHSPDGVLCMFPEWYARKASDWPAQAELTRFPLYDEAEVTEKDEAVERFLAAGDAPVVVTPGSANAQAAYFLKEAAGACEKLGRRGILVTRYPEQVPAGLPESIRAFEYVPFGRVFPRAAAVVHHGGIGTMAQCLAAGVPQLIMPMAHDQPDNAVRVKRMHVGDYLYPKSFKAAAIAEKLKNLLESPEVRKGCEKYKCKMGRQMSEDQMGVLIEEMSERALRVRQINGAGVPG